MLLLVLGTRLGTRLGTLFGMLLGTLFGMLLGTSGSFASLRMTRRQTATVPPERETTHRNAQA